MADFAITSIHPKFLCLFLTGKIGTGVTERVDLKTISDDIPLLTS